MRIDILKPILISLIVTAAGSFSISTLFTSELPISHWLISIAYFTILSLVLNLIYIQKTDSRTFINTIMVSSGARLLASAVAFLIYSYLFGTSTRSFIIHFMFHYIVFTIFEILFLIKIVNTSSQNT